GSVKNTKLTYFLLPKERELSETGFKTYFETAPFVYGFCQKNRGNINNNVEINNVKEKRRI
ncbi:MAG: hypothetical protein H6Q66_1003, partial [Firmicutes bacterium]|nr:hypothetical protein [Bacillota bacterium]